MAGAFGYCIYYQQTNILHSYFPGFKPWKITHASDNFDKLYEYAVELTKRYTYEEEIFA